MAFHTDDDLPAGRVASRSPGFMQMLESTKHIRTLLDPRLYHYNNNHNHINVITHNTTTTAAETEAVTTTNAAAADDDTASEAGVVTTTNAAAAVVAADDPSSTSSSSGASSLEKNQNSIRVFGTMANTFALDQIFDPVRQWIATGFFLFIIFYFSALLFLFCCPVPNDISKILFFCSPGSVLFVAKAVRVRGWLGGLGFFFVARCERFLFL